MSEALDLQKLPDRVGSCDELLSGSPTPPYQSPMRPHFSAAASDCSSTSAALCKGWRQAWQAHLFRTTDGLHGSQLSNSTSGLRTSMTLKVFFAPSATVHVTTTSRGMNIMKGVIASGGFTNGSCKLCLIWKLTPDDDPNGTDYVDVY